MSNASWIQRTAGVCGGDACIRRTRIPVWLLVEEKRQARAESRILVGHPDLTAEDLEVAWAYAQANPNEIERALWANEACMVERDGTIPHDLVHRGRLLGLAEDEIRAAFDPPTVHDRQRSEPSAYTARGRE